MSVCVRVLDIFLDHRKNSNQNENQFKSRSCSLKRWGIFVLMLFREKGPIRGICTVKMTPPSPSWIHDYNLKDRFLRQNHSIFATKKNRTNSQCEVSIRTKSRDRGTGEEWKMVFAFFESGADTTKPTLWFLSALEQLSSQRKTKEGDNKQSELTGAGKKEEKNI